MYYLQSRYYDPQIGRFINADQLASTGQGFLGYNMFAYCNNDPVNYLDAQGMDAYLVIDDDGAVGFGHIGFLVEDDEGKWWHFYWGGKYPNISFIIIVMPATTWFEEYEGDLTLDAINDSGQYGGTYDRMLYFAGDFSESVDYTNGMSGMYSLYFNNCSQVSCEILSRGPAAYKSIFEQAADYLIPKSAFSYLQDQHSSHHPTGSISRNTYSYTAII